MTEPKGDSVLKAWRIYGANDIRLDELPSQPVGADCVKIKVLKTAITHSDNLIYEGKRTAKLPVIPGRHCVAMVSEVGENVKNVARGNKVALSPYRGCGSCLECNQGRSENCENKLEYGLSEDGFLSDFAVVNSGDVYKLPDRIDDGEAMFLEHIATAVSIIGKLGLEKGEHIAIIGASITGIILAQVAMYYQAVPILIDVRRDRLDIASSLGIYYTVDTTMSDAFKKVFSLTGGRMAETCAYMTPGIIRLTRAFEFCCKRGRMTIGVADSEEELCADLRAVVNRRLVVYGESSMGKNMRTAINMLANKSVGVLPLISREISFSQLGSALEEMAKLPEKYLKVVVDMNK